MASRLYCAKLLHCPSYDYNCILNLSVGPTAWFYEFFNILSPLLSVNSIIPILAILASDGKVIMVDAKIHKKKSSKPAYSLDDLVPPTVDNPKDLNIKLFLSGIMSNLCNPPFLLRMCPPLTTKNWPEYKPLMASGGSNGNIQILNMSSGRVEREFATHTFPVCTIQYTQYMYSRHYV